MILLTNAVFYLSNLNNYSISKLLYLLLLRKQSDIEDMTQIGSTTTFALALISLMYKNMQKKLDVFFIFARIRPT
ncbi:hypothetical protein PSYCG_04145 [Psychrobacter sp. G]|nr:hypothetical protein PSYCG_04145 [Psychrobacter sp. G]